MSYKWIMYMQQNGPGNQSFELERVSSDGQAKAVFDDFCEAVYSSECSATLYAYSDESWGPTLRSTATSDARSTTPIASSNVMSVAG